VKRKDLTFREQALAFPCSYCGARRGERCELNTGYPRMDPHVDRLLSAVGLDSNRYAKRDDGGLAGDTPKDKSILPSLLEFGS
jgi:hypothetical protein